MGALVFNFFLLAVFGWAAFETFGWREEVALFPRLAALLGLLLVAAQLIIELRKQRHRAHENLAARTSEGDPHPTVRIGRRGAVWLFAGLSCVILLSVPVGVPLFVLLLSRYGFEESWPVAIGIAAAIAFLIVAVFGGILGANWDQPLLLQLLN